MVTIDGTKYACERCIRGHRVSGCNHVEKPLTMIKKKGRPTTHCNHCRKGKGTKISPIAPHLCSCSDSRRERTVITPKDLALLKQEPGVRIELADGSLLFAEVDGHDYSPTSTTSPGPESPTMPHTFGPLGVTSPVSHSPTRHERMYGAPPRMESRYAGHGADHYASAVVPRHPDESNEPGAYGQDDEYLNVPAFRYETGFFGQPYNVDLYNSASGNNAAAAQANAGGESTATIASVGFPDDTQYSSRFGSMKSRGLPRLNSMSHNPLLATTSQDLEASIKTLSPLADQSIDVGRDETVKEILHSPTETVLSSSQVNNSDTPKRSAKTGSMTDQTQEPYSSVQSMPKLSSLY